MKRFLVTFVLPCLIVLVWVVLPLIRGTETLFLRDVFNTHLGKKWVQAEAMRDGQIPIIDPLRDGGEPHLGNPNTVPLLPDNVLYLVAPTIWAFNAHYWLHLLLAPFAMYWLASTWGLRRQAAWAAGILYAASGFFISNLGFYNLIAGAAWTPAFVAGWLRLARPQSSRRELLPLGIVWSVLLLAGDPMTCVTALFLGLSAAVMRWGWRAAGWLRAAVALALGTIIASPQWVEFLRILPLSYRGHMGFSETAATAASWNPVAVLEWLIPFFFGRPDLAFWGQHLHGGDLPLFPTLYPGILALILVLGSGRPSAASARWAWLVAAAGIFLALGEHNPAVGWLLKIPGTDLMRLPVKFWLMTAIGLAVIGGHGFERLIDLGRRRLFWKIIAVLGVAFSFVWLGFGVVGSTRATWLAERLAGSVDIARLVAEQQVWAGWGLLSIVLLGIVAVVFALGRRSPELAGAGLLVLHLASQFWILQPALPMAPVAELLTPPALLDHVDDSSIVVHGKSNGLFGKTSMTPADYPDARPIWLQRQVVAELYPVVGSLWGRRFDFALSAEGLDAFLTRATAEALRVLPDVKRVRLLASSGVDLLILDRALDDEAAALARLRHHQPGHGEGIFVYQLAAAPRVQLVGGVRRAPHLNAALDWITAPDFDAERTVVLPPGGETLDGPRGSVEVVEWQSQHLELETTSAAPGVLVLQRAFLPVYRARVDGEPWPMVAANIHRLGIELPAGEHRVEIWVDRRPLWISGLAALLALVVLIFLSRSKADATGW